MEVGKIVAFVVARDEQFPDRGQEFDSARAAIDSRLQGAYFKKLELVSGPAKGQVLWSIGIQPYYKVGMEFHGGRCSCGDMVWRHPTAVGPFQCEDCHLVEIMSLEDARREMMELYDDEKD